MTKAEESAKTWIETVMKNVRKEAMEECIEKIKARSAKVVATNNGIVVEGSTTYTISENELYNIKKEMAGDSDG